MQPAGVAGAAGGVMATPTVPLKSEATRTIGAVPLPPHEFGCHPEFTQPLTLAAFAGAMPATRPENNRPKMARIEISGFDVLALCNMTPSVFSLN